MLIDYEPFLRSKFEMCETLDKGENHDENYAILSQLFDFRAV